MVRQGCSSSSAVLSQHHLAHQPSGRDPSSRPWLPHAMGQASSIKETFHGWICGSGIDEFFASRWLFWNLKTEFKEQHVVQHVGNLLVKFQRSSLRRPSEYLQPEGPRVSKVSPGAHLRSGSTRRLVSAGPSRSRPMERASLRATFRLRCAERITPSEVSKDGSLGRCCCEDVTGSHW